MFLRFIVLIHLCLTCFISFAQAEPGGFRQRLSAAHDIISLEDVEAEIKFGRHIAARMLVKYPLYEDEALTRYVNLVGKAVAAQSSRQELNYQFGILNVTAINAFAAPGGFIFITKGAVMQAKDEAELAAVLAHEIAHVTERHIVKALNIRSQETGAGAGLARMIGGVSDPARIALNQAADQAIEILFAAGLSKADELIADNRAMQLLALTGYDPKSLKGYLKRMETQTGEKVKILSTTHPSLSDRISAIDSFISVNKYDELNYPTLMQRFNDNVHIKN